MLGGIVRGTFLRNQNVRCSDCAIPEAGQVTETEIRAIRLKGGGVREGHEVKLT